MHARTAVAFSILLLVASPALANPLTAPELREARGALAAYDLSGGTAAVLRDLSAFIERTYRGANRREARYLRAVAATDLLVLARGERHAAVRGEVASAVGATPETLVPFLDRELAELELGAYADTARECRWALALMQQESVDPRTLREGRGERRDVFFVHAVVDAIGAPDELDRLAELGVDPCSGDDCELAAFTPRGRRAIDALDEANAALARMDAIIAHGEPLAASLAAIVAVDGVVLRTCEIHPALALADDLGGNAGSAGEVARPDVVIAVREGAVDITGAPWARVRASGVELVRPLTPVRIELADDGRAAVVPFERLETQLAALRAELPSGARIGLAASSDVPSLTISRVIVTMLRAGLSAPELLARGDDGEARSLPIELVLGDDVAASLAVFVRLGGYTLHHGPRSIDIPRVRSADGLRFDVATLEQNARAAGAAPLAIRYMGTVAWGAVLDAAFRLRSEPGPLSLVLY